MTAIQKEQIFVELRKYHLDEFPSTFANDDMKALHDEFLEIEDTVITMLLGLVNGKTEYADLSPDVKKFTDKVAATPAVEKNEVTNKALFLSKAEQISQILKMASLGSFMIKAPRAGARHIGKAVTTKVTKS